MRLAPRGGTPIDLEPLQPGGSIYRVPFLDTGPVKLLLRDAFGVETSRTFNAVHSQLRNPAEVTFDQPRGAHGPARGVRPRAARARGAG